MVPARFPRLCRVVPHEYHTNKQTKNASYYRVKQQRQQHIATKQENGTTRFAPKQKSKTHSNVSMRKREERGSMRWTKENQPTEPKKNWNQAQVMYEAAAATATAPVNSNKRSQSKRVRCGSGNGMVCYL